MSPPASWTLPETIQKRFGKNPGKQRAMLANEHLLVNYPTLTLAGTARAFSSPPVISQDNQEPPGRFTSAPID